MCEYQETADKLGTTPTSALDASEALNTSLDHARAVADLLQTAVDGGEYLEDRTPAEAADLIKSLMSDASRAAAELWGAYRGRADTIRTLERQLAEIADAKELLAKRDRLRELLTRSPTHEGALKVMLKPDDTEGGTHD